MPGAPWLPDVERRVARWAGSGLAGGGVVAGSGGGDGGGLVGALHGRAPRVGLTLPAAPLDHGVRGGAAKADAAFVEPLARSLGLPCDLGRGAPPRPPHFEADARR